MKIEIVYVCPYNAGPQYVQYGLRFLASYAANPPGTDHGTTIVCNGASAKEPFYQLFRILPNCKLFEHDNSGFDIGAYQHVALTIPADMMVFFGCSAYVQGSDWLLRMANTFQLHPNSQFGCMGNRGNLAPSVRVWPHIRTTGFWMSPTLLNSYPNKITRPEDRFPFEHGPQCFTQWVKSVGRKNYVVTRRGTYEVQDWDSDPNGFQRGDQSSLLSGDRMCEPPYYPRAR